jgi:hypothetical protein
MRQSSSVKIASYQICLLACDSGRFARLTNTHSWLSTGNDGTKQDDTEVGLLEGVRREGLEVGREAGLGNSGEAALDMSSEQREAENDMSVTTELAREEGFNDKKVLLLGLCAAEFIHSAEVFVVNTDSCVDIESACSVESWICGERAKISCLQVGTAAT